MEELKKKILIRAGLCLGLLFKSRKVKNVLPGKTVVGTIYTFLSLDLPVFRFFRGELIKSGKKLPPVSADY
ncbi:hypothetical protein [Thermosyntropha lipolytica]|uniref:hypothetical protein n=1 Tax=Thermosyntropha lipolytica TaxID=54294 RepID=UPI0009344D68|nr:hypothetical protein [Thermosyntropha lipolytica]